MAAAVQQRQWYLDDKTENRTYDFAVEQEARQYERAQLEDTRAYSRQVLQHLTEDATAAGFNPLTVLRGGGASSYNAAAGLAPLSATRSFSSPAQPMTVPSKQAVGGSAMGAAMQAVGDFLENFDPFADQKKEQEYQLVASQIAALNAGALSGAERGSASYASGTTERRPSGVGGQLGKPSKWQVGDVNVTNPLPWGLEVNPGAADGSAFEDRWGEVGGSVAGLGVFGADVWHNGKKLVKSYWNQSKPNDTLMGAARWVDKTFGLKPSKKSGRLSKPFTGGGGGW